MIKILELFGGIGACTQAFKRLGIPFEIADYVEIDKYAVKSYNAINDTNFEPQDITKWDKDLDVDFIMHRSPCQDFSIAGKQAGGDENSGTRSSLMYETLRIVNKLKPKYVLWENVKNVLSKKHKHNFDNYIDIMSEYGYNSYYKVLNARDFGTPQNRERVFTLSIRKDIDLGYSFPNGEPLNIRLRDILESNVDEKYYLSDKKLIYILDANDVALSSGIDINNSIVNPQIAKTISCRGAVDQRANITNFVIDGEQEEIRVRNLKERLCDYLLENNKVKEYDVIDHNYTTNRKTQVDDDTNIVKGRDESPTLTTRPDTLGVTVLGGIGEKKSNGGRQWFQQDRIYDDKVALSVSTCCQPYYKNDLRIRKLTPRECWRLMTFSDDAFDRASKVNSNAQLYKQAGNSIVVNVLEKILRNLFKE